MEKKRYAGLDCLRGCILISMILYHGTWDLVYLFGVPWKWFQSTFAYMWQQSICWGFILLSGYCWHFGKKHWERGLKVLMAGVIVTLVTKVFMPSQIIMFGVLTMLGSCMILTVLLDKGLKRWNPAIGLILFFGLFLITRNVNQGYLGVGSRNWLQLPSILYANHFTTYLGFMQPGFFSADYFSIIPWLFLFLTGYFLQNVLKKWDLWEALCSVECKWLEWLGKHSLLIYMFHQPVTYVVLYAYINVLGKVVEK